MFAVGFVMWCIGCIGVAWFDEYENDSIAGSFAVGTIIGMVLMAYSVTQLAWKYLP